MGLLDQRLADDRSILQHVLQVDQVAVMLLLCKIIGVVKMNDSLFMGTHDFFRKQHAFGQVLAYLAGHIVTLG